MSWLKVPKAVDETPSSHSSLTSTPSWAGKQGRDSSEFDSNITYSDIDNEYTGDSDASYEVEDEHDAGSRDMVTPGTHGRDDTIKKDEKSEHKDDTEESSRPPEKVYANISQYFMAFHANNMEAWYETTLNMLINRQEYAVEAVKLEWLLKRTPRPSVRNKKKSQRETTELKEITGLSTIKETSGSDKEEYSRGENTNTLSDISDEIMDGKRKRNKNKKRKHDPIRDARRLYNLMKY